MKVASFVFVGAVALAAPVFANSVPVGFSTKVMCEGLSGRVGFADEAAMLEMDERLVTLPQTLSASGARYEDEAEDVLFWIKGEEALLGWNGVEMNCALAGGEAPWTARGNEPGWRVSVSEGQMLAELDYGETVVEAELPVAQLRDEGLLYDATELDLLVSPELCRDDMSGQVYPETVTLTRGETSFRGCAGETMDLLSGPEWQIEDVAGAGVIDASNATLAFDGDRVAGSTGCNRYMGGVEVTGDGLRFGQLASTQMMCPESLMQQEARVLEALAKVERFDIDETGALVLYSQGERLITARR
ncbi:META domain-containing protein [Celeribacter sp. PS-C1]|uniref:META domain-containing protein n=1 Tax=Celeribacter sp. PS-C1 TaxID=2820813 RepID=UPI001CA507BE|nr:META domain-containing protein [Celeribacter sp. PS-C1]MBW6416372.1 META domain-containing protein [Celeribacter sp. PS-C1]